MESWFIQDIVTFIETSSLILLWGPLIAFFFAFCETVGIIGFFIPLNALFVWLLSLAYSREDRWLLISLLTLSAIVWLFLWLLVSYILWKKYFYRIIWRVKTKRPSIEKYFTQMDTMIEKYHLVAFPLMMFHLVTRPLMWLYLWSRHYSFSRYLWWSILGICAYIIPSVLVWVWLWSLGAVAKNNLWWIYKYLIVSFLVILVLYFLYDIFSKKKI